MCSTASAGPLKYISYTVAQIFGQVDPILLFPLVKNLFIPRFFKKIAFLLISKTANGYILSTLNKKSKFYHFVEMTKKGGKMGQPV